MAELPSNIIQAREAATSAASGAGQLASQEYTIGDMLKKKVLEAYSDNQDIIGGLDTATAGYTGAPSAGRAKFEGIFNPTQKEALVSQYTGNQAIPMLSLASILGQRFGRIDDTIGAGTRGFQAYAGAQQADATNKQNLYTSLLNEYQIQENTRQAMEAERIAREKLAYDKSNAGGGAYDLATALQLLGIVPGGTPQTRDPIEFAIEEDETPAWQDPLKEVQKQRELSQGIDWGNVNLSGVKGLNSGVVY